MTCTDECIHNTNCPFKGEGLFFADVIKPIFSFLRLFLIGSAIFLRDRVPTFCHREYVRLHCCPSKFQLLDVSHVSRLCI